MKKEIRQKGKEHCKGVKKLKKWDKKLSKKDNMTEDFSPKALVIVKRLLELLG